MRTVTLKHSCTVCKNKIDHNGNDVIKEWCKKCSSISVYKAIGGNLYPANKPRLMITVVA